MRKLLITCSVVVIVLASLPMLFGLLAKHALHKITNDLVPPAGMLLSLEDYQLGYLHSQATVRVTLTDATPIDTDYLSHDEVSIAVHGRIDHGPLVKTPQGRQWAAAYFDLHTALDDIQGLQNEFMEALQQLFSDEYLIHADSRLSFNGDMAINLHTSAIHSQAGGDLLQWGGMQADIAINDRLNRAKTQVTLAPILFTTQEGATLDAAQITFSADIQREDQFPWVGEQNLNIPTLFLQDQQGDVLRFDHFTVRSVSELIAQPHALVNATLAIQAENIDIASEHIEQLRFHLDLENLAAEPLQDFMQQISQKKGEVLSSRERQDLLKVAVKTLRPGTHAQLEYLVNMSQGPVRIQLTVDFPDLTQADYQSALRTSQQLLAGLYAELDATAPTQLLEDTLFDIALSESMRQIAEETVDTESAEFAAQKERLKQNLSNTLENLVAVNALIEREQAYHIDLRYEQGQITLNNQPLSDDEVLLLIVLLLQITDNEMPDASTGN